MESLPSRRVHEEVSSRVRASKAGLGEVVRRAEAVAQLVGERHPGHGLGEATALEII